MTLPKFLALVPRHCFEASISALIREELRAVLQPATTETPGSASATQPGNPTGKPVTY